MFFFIFLFLRPVKTVKNRFQVYLKQTLRWLCINGLFLDKRPMLYGLRRQSRRNGLLQTSAQFYDAIAMSSLRTTVFVVYTLWKHKNKFRATELNNVRSHFVFSRTDLCPQFNFKTDS